MTEAMHADDVQRLQLSVQLMASSLSWRVTYARGLFWCQHDDGRALSPQADRNQAERAWRQELAALAPTADGLFD